MSSRMQSGEQVGTKPAPFRRRRTETGVTLCNMCERWWYKEQANGFCEKEAWHKNTTIAVPIVIIVKKKASGTEKDAVSMKQGKIFDKA